MDRVRVKGISDDLRNVLGEFAIKHGLESVEFKNITFDAKGFRTTITATEKLDEEEKVQDFDMKAMMVGLPKGLYGKEVNLQGETYTITGINTKARKYPIEADGEDGKRYKLPRSVVESK